MAWAAIMSDSLVVISNDPYMVGNLHVTIHLNKALSSYMYVAIYYD